MTLPNVVVTGMGIVTSIGWSPEEVQESILNKRCGFRGISCLDSPLFKGTLAGEVLGDPAAKSGLAEGSRSDHLALYAARQAFVAAGLEGLTEDVKAEIGIALGITTGGLSTTEVYLDQLLTEGDSDIAQMRFHECSTPVATISRELGLFGIQTSVSNACASSANALALGREFIQSGEAEVVLAGGVDSLSRLTVNGFNSLLVYDPDGCRPFDENRSGMTLGEGAGFVILESEAHANARDARTLAHFVGAGSSFDGFHITSPSPDGSAIHDAMSKALADAGRVPSDIDYINAHGTGTLDNDASEGEAIQRLFDGDVPVVSSTKGYCGHTLAAAGAVESILCILAMEHGVAPPNLGIENVDPAFRFDPIREPIETGLNTVMTNSIGFGGNNCSLIFENGDSNQ